jgi:hypothetical protein
VFFILFKNAAGLEPATSGLEIRRQNFPKLNVAKELRRLETVAVLPVVLDYLPLNVPNFLYLPLNALCGNFVE